MISIVVPVFNEEDNVFELHQRILAELKQLNTEFEIIFVDDCSTDKTVEKMKQLKPIRVLRLRKNCGQTSAMDAGFHAAKGKYIVTLDGDLQNDPSDIGRLIKKLDEGYDVASGWRVDRQDSLGRKILSRLANWLTYQLSGLYLHDSACAMKAYRAEFLKDINLYGEMHVFLPALLHGQGAKVIELPVKHHERKAGISKHHFMKAVKNIADLMTIKFMSQYMGRPLVFFSALSIGFCLLGFISATTATILKIMAIRNYGQTPLPILTVLFIIIGFLLFMMGFLAELMTRIYWESQNKKPYAIRETFENE